MFKIKNKLTYKELPNNIILSNYIMYKKLEENMEMINNNQKLLFDLLNRDRKTTGCRGCHSPYLSDGRCFDIDCIGYVNYVKGE
jgi:hypothetical protein